MLSAPEFMSGNEDTFTQNITSIAGMINIYGLLILWSHAVRACSEESTP